MAAYHILLMSLLSAKLAFADDEILKKIQNTTIGIPGFIHIDRPNGSTRDFPRLGLYVFADKNTSLYITQGYGGNADHGKTAIRKDIYLDRFEKQRLALTVLEKDRWGRKYRNQSLQAGIFLRTLPNFKIRRSEVSFSLNLGYDIEQDAIAYIRINVLP